MARDRRNGAGSATASASQAIAARQRHVRQRRDREALLALQGGRVPRGGVEPVGRRQGRAELPGGRAVRRSCRSVHPERGGHRHDPVRREVRRRQQDSCAPSTTKARRRGPYHLLGFAWVPGQRPAPPARPALVRPARHGQPRRPQARAQAERNKRNLAYKPSGADRTRGKSWRPTTARRSRSRTRTRS
jgi:hypothetical protein